MFLGLDYSYDHPSVDVSRLKGFGYHFVMRYLCYSRVNSAGNDATKKRLFPAEVAKLRQNGLLIGLNWEYEVGDQRGGFSAGQIHAQEAVNQAKSLGAPEGTAIYFSTDFQVLTAVEFATVDAYFAGARPIVNSNGYRIGQYGQYSAIKRSFDRKQIDVGWQTYAWSTFADTSGGVKYLHWDSRAAIRQVQNGLTVAGGNVDRDEAHHEAYFWEFC
jgi:hypothetical protein